MLGTVQINNLNLKQGELTSVENYFLFTGIAAADCPNTGKLVTVDQATDLDAVLGAAASDLKTQVTAARLNAGQNWYGCLLPYTVDESTADAMDAAFESAVSTAMEHVKVEAIIRTDPITRAASVESMQALAESIMAKYMRPLWIMARAPEFNGASQTFADYQAQAAALQQGIAADQVMLTTSLWGHEQGTLAGRLANEAVTVADSPLRVSTGALVGVWSSKPTDKTGRVIDISVLKALDAARFSVPQWYPDYEGMYWGDGNVLDVNGGDFQVIENLRVIQKCMRRVYPLAVARIGDRRLNQTPASIAQAQTAFMAPLRTMSRTRTILGIVFPGEIEPPKEGDITLTWVSKYSVEVYIAARPYNCPKKITCNLLLDLTNYATGA
ncbi:DUF2586 domain-containing protein [Desulfovibrio falkowii]|uniref:DUF2586 domain-containing protein n=1 Tax=Desulfovibrio falkowii TaxID=3136602 RepID=A0ABQ0EAE1_9BACT